MIYHNTGLVERPVESFPFDESVSYSYHSYSSPENNFPYNNNGNINN